jgi:hypothetical protein
MMRKTTYSYIDLAYIVVRGVRQYVGFFGVNITPNDHLPESTDGRLRNGGEAVGHVNEAPHLDYGSHVPTQ